MRPSSLEKRVTRLETLSRLAGKKRRSAESAEPPNEGAAFWLQQLQELPQEARRLQVLAESTRDYRTALACVQQLGRFIELMTKLQDDRTQTSGLNVDIDSDTAKRIAETYLALHEDKESK
jgi:GTP-dependent phosphoenolpyruvate carboxykinase